MGAGAKYIEFRHSTTLLYSHVIFSYLQGTGVKKFKVNFKEKLKGLCVVFYLRFCTFGNVNILSILKISLKGFLKLA